MFLVWKYNNMDEEENKQDFITLTETPIEDRKMENILPGDYLQPSSSKKQIFPWFMF